MSSAGPSAGRVVTLTLTLAHARCPGGSCRPRCGRRKPYERIRTLFLHSGAETDSNLQFVGDMLTKKAFDREAVLRTDPDVRRGRRVPDKELD